MGNSPSSPPEVHIVTSRTLPPVVVDEINTWLCNNVVDLVNEVSERYYHGGIEIRKTQHRKDVPNLAYAVFRSKLVRQLPIYVNVANTARHVLIGYIERKRKGSSLRKTSAYFKCGKQTYEIRLTDVEKTPDPTDPPAGLGYASEPEIVENAKPGEFIKTKASLYHPAEYWKIINEADAYDKNPGRFIQALKRAELKWGADKKTWREIFAGVLVVPANFSERLKGAEKVAESNWGKLDADGAKFKSQLYRTMPNLVPIASQSKAISQFAVVENKKTTSSHHHPAHEYSEDVVAILQNDRCNRFWNSRYLFHLDEKKGRKGMAIDTMTGIVTNIDFRFKHNRYEFVHSPATTRRWERFCEGEDGSFPWDKFRVLTRDMWMKFDPEITTA